MIEIRIEERVAQINHSNVLQALDLFLDKTKFFGTILLTYEAGQIKYIKPTQNFTVDSLIEHLSK